MDEPKKYIRTFTGDMESFKKRLTPNLVPLKEKFVPPPPVSATPIQPAPSLKPADQPAPIIKTEPHTSPIKTYEGDFSQRLKDTHASTATVLAAEQDATSRVPQDAPEKPPRGNILYIIAGTVLLILGIIGAYIAYTGYLTNTQPIVLAPTVSAPIFVDEQEKIVGATQAVILKAIKQSVIRSLAPNSVRFLYTDFATTTDNSVFSALQLPAPGALLRNVDATQSMAGVVNSGGNQSLFFILSVTSYSDTFAGMLSWEPKMPRNLVALFPPYPQVQVSTTTVATSTTPSIVPAPAFHDEVVNNHDVRVYRDTEGKSVLLYGYWNQTTLVIARDPSAFIEIIGRLATARSQQK